MKNICKLFVLGVLVFLVACGGIEGTKVKHMEKAAKNFEKKHYDKARVSYLNVLKIDPRDLPARLGYAETLIKLKQWQQAVGQYRGIITEHPENKTAKLSLGRLYLLANEAALAMALAEEVLVMDDANAKALTLKAGSFASQGRRPEALEVIKHAYTIEPNDTDTILLYASLLNSDKKGDQAVKLVERELKNHPESISLHTFLSRAYLSAGQKDDAERELKMLVELEPDNINLKNQLVFFYEKSGKPQQAESVLTTLIASSENKTAPIISLFDLHMFRGDKDKAVAMLRKEINADDDNHDLQFRLAVYFTKNQQNDKAQRIYQSLSEKDEMTAEKAKIQLAYLHETQGQLEASKVLVEEVLHENAGNIEALTLRGMLYLRNNDALSAVSDFRTVLNADLDNPEIITLLGRAHVMNGDTDLALDMFMSAQNLKPKDIQISMQLATLYRQKGEALKVVDQMEIAHNLAPQNIQILEQLIQAYMPTNNADKSELAVKRFIELGGDMARGSYYLGLIAQSRNQHEKAVAQFSQSLEAKPGAVEPMSGKVRSLLAQNKKKDALAWLTEVASQLKDNAVAYNLKGELLLSDKEYSKAVVAFEKAHEIKPEWWVPYRSHAMAYVSQNNHAKALNALKLGIKNTTGNPKLRAQAALIAQNFDNVDEAVNQYEAILDMDATNKFAANKLAMLLVNNRSDEAGMLQRATELSAILEVSNEKTYSDTLGWVAYANGQYEEALPLIKTALAAYPDRAEIQYHIGMTYFQLNDTEKAKLYLAEALSSEKSFTGKDNAKATLVLLESS
ncbi:MAG: tetratricopeptide repeat protein [Gammaproteobacteria bacterium]|nr:tetratricopeptide repeat protein [Gammaproteobacteria bacterium]